MLHDPAPCMRRGYSPAIVPGSAVFYAVRPSSTVFRVPSADQVDGRERHRPTTIESRRGGASGAKVECITTRVVSSLIAVMALQRLLLPRASGAASDGAALRWSTEGLNDTHAHRHVWSRPRGDPARLEGPPGGARGRAAYLTIWRLSSRLALMTMAGHMAGLISIRLSVFITRSWSGRSSLIRLRHVSMRFSFGHV